MITNDFRTTSGSSVRGTELTATRVARMIPGNISSSPFDLETSAQRQGACAPRRRTPTPEGGQLVGARRPALDNQLRGPDDLKAPRDLAARPRLPHDEQAPTVGRKARRLDVPDRRVGFARRGRQRVDRPASIVGAPRDPELG